MSRGARPSALSDGELNGLVDGFVDAGRQAELQQRLKAYPLDRARIDAWREHNDLIRATFSEVEGETLPVSLSLAPMPRLRCVTSDGRSTALQAAFAAKAGWATPAATKSAPGARTGQGPAGPDPGPIRQATPGRIRPVAVSVAACIVGLAGVCFLHLHAASLDGPTTTATRAQQTEGIDSGGAIAVDTMVTEADLRGLAGRPRAKDDGVLAARTLQGLLRAPREDRYASVAPAIPLDLPLAFIPDLGAAGFGFTGATRLPDEPASLVFFYRNTDGAERIALGVTTVSAGRLDKAGDKSAGDRNAGGESVDPTVTWRRDGRDFALVGTIDQRRLNAIADLLQQTGAVVK